MKRRGYDSIDWQSQSMLTPVREQVAFLLGGLVLIIVAASVLTLF